EPTIAITDEPLRNGNANGHAEGTGRGTNGVTPSPAQSARSAGAVALATPRREPPPPEAPVLRPAVIEDGEAKEGWVSDLLRRASNDEDAVAMRPPAANGSAAAPASTKSPGSDLAARPAGGPSALNAFSGDIARAIDHNAAVELWDRHGRGEKNLFTRRLYTLQGQQTFDDIRRKYQRDQDFRTEVDRYVSDFEKLLAEVTK